MAAVGLVKIGFHVLGREALHFLFLQLWGNAVIGGVALNEPFLDRPVQCVMEHEVDAANRGGTQTGGFLFLDFSQPTIFT